MYILIVLLTFTYAITCYYMFVRSGKDGYDHLHTYGCVFWKKKLVREIKKITNVGCPLWTFMC